MNWNMRISDCTKCKLKRHKSKLRSLAENSVHLTIKSHHSSARGFMLPFYLLSLVPYFDPAKKNNNNEFTQNVSSFNRLFLIQPFNRITRGETTVSTTATAKPVV